MTVTVTRLNVVACGDGVQSTALGKHPVWLTGLNRPLHTIPAAQDMLPGFNGDESSMDGLCDNGACFT